MKKRILTFLLVILQMVSLTISSDWNTQAYTEEFVTNSGIVYPISLDTGKDAQNHLVFPDAQFFQYIKNEKFQTGSYTGYPFDLDEDGFLSKDECELVRVLTISGKNDITSVSGMEAFPKLRELYCSGSGIDNLDLTNNPRLQKLTCSDTKLTSLDVSHCPLLTDLKISGCQLTSLDLSTNTALCSLTCMYQERDAYEYLENSQYKVSLTDWDKNIDLKRISRMNSLIKHLAGKAQPVSLMMLNHSSQVMTSQDGIQPRPMVLKSMTTQPMEKYMQASLGEIPQIISLSCMPGLPEKHLRYIMMKTAAAKSHTAKGYGGTAVGFCLPKKPGAKVISLLAGSAMASG